VGGQNIEEWPNEWQAKVNGNHKLDEIKKRVAPHAYTWRI